jgi:hypothetical protein
MPFILFLLENYHLIEEKIFACPIDSERYAGGDISSC